MSDIATIGIVPNPYKPQIKEPLAALDQWISENKTPIRFILQAANSQYIEKKYACIQKTTEKKVLEQSDILITLGGDGTILRLAHLVGDLEIPILGVNLGGLGFLAETSPETLLDHVQKVLSGRYVIEARTCLQCHVDRYNDSFIALNDIVIDKAGFSRVIEVVTRVDGHLLNSYIADGLILSTPTGSTGYSLSAGGPIVVPHTNVFIVNPICPHSLTNRPVVVPDTSVINITAFTEHQEIHLNRDGEKVKSYPSGVSFTIRKTGFNVNLIKMENHNFFDTIRAKLHWGEDFRDKKRWLKKNGS